MKTETKTIEEAFENALKVAKKIILNISFNFNGIDCGWASWGTTEKGVENYYKSLEKGLKYTYNI